MDEENIDEDIEDYSDIPRNPKDLKEEHIEKLAKRMAEDLTEQGFPKVWNESKEDLKLMSRKEACEEMFFAGAVESFFTFMKESMVAWKELPDSEEDLWDDGGFAQSMSSEDMNQKMSTFHKRHDEDMNFECKICKVKISAHNKDWHDGMCDNCFNNKYHPNLHKEK